MKERNKLMHCLRNLRIPMLSLKHRILLYALAALFTALALLNVTFAQGFGAAGIIVYVIAACTFFPGMYYLTLDIAHVIKREVRDKIAANPYINKVTGNYRLRAMVFTVPGLFGNLLFALFNGLVGILSLSPWFGTLSAYYILLSMMRIAVVKQERRISRINEKEQRFRREIAVYRKNSLLFILMAVVLTGMVILLESSQGGKSYPGFTIYAAAAYTFYKIILSSIHMAKVGRQKSPLLTIVRRIGYIDACVSILTLQTAMFASFADVQEEAFIKTMNGVTGGVVCIIVLYMGIQGLYSAKRMGILVKNGRKS